MLTPSQTERLALAKYLLHRGREQANHAQPMSSASLLLFHDAIELVLRVATEYLGRVPRKEALADYFIIANEILSTRTPPKTLPEEGPISRLNKARVALKHYGTIPRAEDVREYSDTATRFFDQTFPIVFGVELQHVTIIDFVSCQEAREFLKAAQAALEAGDQNACVEGTALAFDALSRDYEDRKRGGWGDSPFAIGAPLHPPHSINWRFGPGRSAITKPIEDLTEYLGKVSDALDATREALRIVLLGIDYRKYALFRQFTPRVMHMLQGPARLLHRNDQNSLSQEQRQFCVDFVLETALHLQQFDFDLVTP